MSVVRRILRTVIHERLKISHSDPPLAVTRRNAQLVKMFFARGGPRRRKLGVVFILLTNGDWEDEANVWHHCAGPHCCESPAATLDKFDKYVVPGLAGVMFSLLLISICL